MTRILTAALLILAPGIAGATLSPDATLFEGQPHLRQAVWTQPVTEPLPASTIACIAPLLTPVAELPEGQTRTAALTLPQC